MSSPRHGGSRNTQDHPQPAERAYMGMFMAATSIPPAFIVGVLQVEAGFNPLLIVPLIASCVLGGIGIMMVWRSLSHLDSLTNDTSVTGKRLDLARAKFVGGTFIALAATPIGVMGLVQITLIGSEPTLDQVLMHIMISMAAVLLGSAGAFVALFAIHGLHTPARKPEIRNDTGTAS